MSAQPIDTMHLPSEALNMGSPVAEYGPSATRPWLFVTVLIVLGVGMCGIGGLGMWAGEGLAIAGVILGLLLVFGAAGVGYSSARNRGLRVVVFEKGLVRVSSSQSDIVRWDDITDVYQEITVHYTNGIKTGTTHAYTVIHGNTQTAFNDSIKNVEALGSTIQDEATRRLLPKYAEAYNSGGTVTFGKLTLSKAGISNGKEAIPWDQVEAVNIREGQISVRKQGKWLGWAGQTAAATPNLFIFLTMVDQIVGINQKRK